MAMNPFYVDFFSNRLSPM